MVQTQRNYWLEMHFNVRCGACTPFLYKSKRKNSWSWCRAVQKLLDKEMCPAEAYYNQFKIKAWNDGQKEDSGRTATDDKED